VGGESAEAGGGGPGDGGAFTHSHED
jgi:hypothetical protein